MVFGKMCFIEGDVFGIIFGYLMLGFEGEIDKGYRCRVFIRFCKFFYFFVGYIFGDTSIGNFFSCFCR